MNRLLQRVVPAWGVVVAAGLALPGSPAPGQSAAQERQLAVQRAGLTQPSSPSVSGPVELVFLRDRGPLLVRLNVTVDGKPIQDHWEAYLGQWFDFLDRKGQGALDEAALVGAPKAAFMRNLAIQGIFFPNRGTSATLADFGKSAGQTVSRAEFLDYYRKNSVAPIQPGAAPAEATGPANDALFKKLDTNQDGKLSRAELEAARALIPQTDSDDDELVSMRELAPGVGQPINRGFVVDVPRQPVAPFQGNLVYHLPSESSRAGLAKFILAKYDKQKRFTVSQKEIGLDDAAFARLDENKNGTLDLMELSKFPRNSAAVELTVNLRGGTPAAGVTVSNPGPVPPGQVRVGGGTVNLALDDADIAVQGMDGSQARIVFNQLNFITQQFKAADTKMRGYVELRDLDDSQPAILRSLFPVLDRNEDGKLTDKEVEVYVNLQGQGRGFSASFYVQEQGRNWFQILDPNRDGQLAPRELLMAWQRLAPHDKNGDGVIDAAELPVQFRVAFGQPNPGFAFAAPFGERQRGFDPRGSYPPRAPVWFVKMDRNRDGDVSRLEFLGSREDFDRLDRNGDALLDAEEAAALSRK